MSLWDKAAAVLHSLVRNHALVDGNKRLGLTCAVLMLRRIDVHVAFDADEAYDLVIAVAEGRLEVPAIAAPLQTWLVPAGQ